MTPRLDGMLVRHGPKAFRFLRVFDPPWWAPWRWVAFAWRRFSLTFAPAWPFVHARRVRSERCEVVVGTPPRRVLVRAEPLDLRRTRIPGSGAGKVRA